MKRFLVALVFLMLISTCILANTIEIPDMYITVYVCHNNVPIDDAEVELSFIGSTFPNVDFYDVPKTHGPGLYYKAVKAPGILYPIYYPQIQLKIGDKIKRYANPGASNPHVYLVFDLSVTEGRITDPNLPGIVPLD